MSTYSDDAFIAAMHKAVEIRGGDYTYPTRDEHPEYWTHISTSPDPDPDEFACRYQLDDGTPACIIGLALSLIDPKLVPSSRLVVGGGEVLRILGAPASLSLAAGRAQRVQDQGGPWGEALSEFEQTRRFDR